MSSFLYFCDRASQPITLEQTQEWGLGYAFDSKPASCPIEGRTPSGAPGWLFFDHARLGNAFPGYNSALQEWRKIPSSDLWVGFDKGNRPGPETLMRSKVIDGELVALADDQQWLIPRLRIFAGARGFQSVLTVLADLDDEGNWVAGKVVDGEKFDALADRLIEGMIYSIDNSEIAPLTTSEMLNISTSLLQANYYVDKIEVAMLGLLTNDDLLERVGDAAVEVLTALEWAEKKNAGSSLPAGDS